MLHAGSASMWKRKEVAFPWRWPCIYTQRTAGMICVYVCPYRVAVMEDTMLVCTCILHTMYIHVRLHKLQGCVRTNRPVHVSIHSFQNLWIHIWILYLYVCLYVRVNVKLMYMNYTYTHGTRVCASMRLCVYASVRLCVFASGLIFMVGAHKASQACVDACTNAFSSLCTLIWAHDAYRLLLRVIHTSIHWSENRKDVWLISRCQIRVLKLPQHTNVVMTTLQLCLITEVTYTHIHTFTHTYIPLHTRPYIYIHIHTFTFTSIPLLTCPYPYIHVRASTYTSFMKPKIIASFLCMPNLRSCMYHMIQLYPSWPSKDTCMYTYTCAWAYVHTHMFHIHTYIHTFIRVHVYTCAYLRINTLYACCAHLYTIRL